MEGENIGTYGLYTKDEITYLNLLYAKIAKALKSGSCW